MKVRTLVSSPESLRHAVDLAREFLEKGEFVIAPTETSYGLLANARDEEAVQRLFAVKGREAHKPSAIFVKTGEDLRKYGVRLDNLQADLIRKFWPGPVTFVLKSDWPRWPGILSRDGRIGFRCSPHPFIQWLIASCQYPLTATSANLSGKKAESKKDFEKCFADKAKLLIIDPELKFSGPPSTIVGFSENELEILREGIVDSRLIWKEYRMLKNTDKIFRVMFVCTGNTCRSPMAEGILKKMAFEEGFDYLQVSSAGISTYDGYPASAFAVQVLHASGIDISNLHSTQLTAALMSEADLIIAMAQNHMQKMSVLYPKDAHKVFMLKEYPRQIGNPELSVADPIGLDLGFYHNIFAEIKRELERIWPDIKRKYFEKIRGKS